MTVLLKTIIPESRHSFNSLRAVHERSADFSHTQKIKMVDGRPVWQKEVKCFGCFACLNYCPEQSIQVASTWYLKSRTAENGRYHHPQVTANDIAAQKGWRK
jgi:NAD-dependent dihydropyrimidine dehydrogenase PreA subunit